MRRLLNLVQLYGKQDVLQAIARANALQTYDAAYVETILLQERRRQELPSPTPLRPKRQELIDDIEYDEPDPADYDKLFGHFESEEAEAKSDHSDIDQSDMNVESRGETDDEAK